MRALVDLPADATSPRAARHVVDGLLPAWGLAELVDDAKLVVSELVTNALHHASGPESYELELTARPDGVRIALADGSTVRPILEELNDERPSGRGIRIIEQLASRWGADDHEGGKQVWIELTTGAARHRWD
jgi:anti-sigma regulatory factor (Ser/Thr protein kinase)